MPNETPDINNSVTPGQAPNAGNYDYLFEPEPEFTISNNERDGWPVLQDYQKEWFAPPNIDSAKEHSSTIDYLDDSLERSVQVARSGRRGDGGRSVTKETEAQAESIIEHGFHDPVISAIIREHSPKDAKAIEIVELIRQNPGIREDLARYFLAKIGRNTLSVPHRVAVNTVKNPNHTDYPSQMYSRDYSALLAISKLDGTYNAGLSQSKGTLPEYDWEKREYITGQHQAAANFLLFDERHPIERTIRR